MRVAAEKALTLRELNRAMLARQLLLERTKLGIVAAIERLPALQAQWAPSPYYALWARLAHFTRERLWAAIESHRVIRARLMRGTLHLVSARDFYAYAVATQDLQRGAWNRVARDVLLDRRSRERGIVNPSAVERLLAGHAAGVTDGGDRIWSLMNLELWYRTFIDRDGVQTLPVPGALAPRAAQASPAALNDDRRWGWGSTAR